jgi:hypothetical protein
MNKLLLGDNLEPDTTVIPFGDYCYEVFDLKPGEVLNTEGEFGKDRREAGYSPNGGNKRVLCPYWFELDNGMTRCEYLEIEDDENSYLADEIKICDMAVEDIQTYTRSRKPK